MAAIAAKALRRAGPGGVVHAHAGGMTRLRLGERDLTGRLAEAVVRAYAVASGCHARHCDHSGSPPTQKPGFPQGGQRDHQSAPGARELRCPKPCARGVSSPPVPRPLPGTGYSTWAKSFPRMRERCSRCRGAVWRPRSANPGRGDPVAAGHVVPGSVGRGTDGHRQVCCCHALIAADAARDAASETGKPLRTFFRSDGHRGALRRQRSPPPAPSRVAVPPAADAQEACGARCGRTPRSRSEDRHGRAGRAHRGSVIPGHHRRPLLPGPTMRSARRE